MSYYNVAHFLYIIVGHFKCSYIFIRTWLLYSAVFGKIVQAIPDLSQNETFDF